MQGSSQRGPERLKLRALKLGREEELKHISNASACEAARARQHQNPTSPQTKTLTATRPQHGPYPQLPQPAVCLGGGSAVWRAGRRWPGRPAALRVGSSRCKSARGSVCEYSALWRSCSPPFAPASWSAPELLAMRFLERPITLMHVTGSP